MYLIQTETISSIRIWRFTEIWISSGHSKFSTKTSSVIIDHLYHAEKDSKTELPATWHAANTRPRLTAALQSRVFETPNHWYRVDDMQSVHDPLFPSPRIFMAATIFKGEKVLQIHFLRGIRISNFTAVKCWRHVIRSLAYNLQSSLLY